MNEQSLKNKELSVHIVTILILCLSEILSEIQSLEMYITFILLRQLVLVTRRLGGLPRVFGLGDVAQARVLLLRALEVEVACGCGADLQVGVVVGLAVVPTHAARVRPLRVRVRVACLRLGSLGLFVLRFGSWRRCAAFFATRLLRSLSSRTSLVTDHFAFNSESLQATRTIKFGLRITSRVSIVLVPPIMLCVAGAVALSIAPRLLRSPFL